MESTPKRQVVARIPVSKEDIKQFDPLASPSPKKSGLIRQRQCAIDPLLEAKARTPFQEANGNRFQVSVSKPTPPNRVGRFCIRHSFKHDGNPQRGIEIDITVGSDTGAQKRNADILDLLF